jgi:putative two-component system response regulator
MVSQAIDVHQADILIMDDEFSNVLLLERVLEQGGFTKIRSLTDPRLFFDAIANAEPDIILLDLNMPYLDGLTLMKELAAQSRPATFIPILILTADNTAGTRQDALTAGANDFLTKPFDVLEVLLRVKNLLKMRFLHNQLHSLNMDLEGQVKERTRDLQEAQIEILERLGLATEYRDDDTGAHIRRVADLSAEVARALGEDEKYVEMMRVAAPLHDIGKIGIEDGILMNPGKLTAEEFDAMKHHTRIGASILAGSRCRLLQLAEEIALTHHECWDGRGYPDGISGEDIPLSGRIVSVVDVFDALTNRRPYKEPWPVQDAIDEIVRLSGTKFDPRIVEAFLKVMAAEPAGRMLREYELAA